MSTPETEHHAGPADENAIWFLGGLLVVKASGDTTNGAFDLIEQQWPAGFRSPPHAHQREEQTFYVLDGSVTFEVGGRTISARPGTVVLCPRGTVHAFAVDSAAPARMLALYTPAGMKDFFEESGEPASAHTLPPSSTLDIAPLLEHAPKYGMLISPSETPLDGADHTGAA